MLSHHPVLRYTGRHQADPPQSPGAEGRRVSWSTYTSFWRVSPLSFSSCLGCRTSPRRSSGFPGSGSAGFSRAPPGFPAVGVLIGALVTALIQSSSATSVITLSLVNGGVLSFQNSVGVIFGANIGSTVTAQLVAFKLTAFAPAMIIVGFALSFVRSRVSLLGKSIFFFGFVFFSLNLISAAMGPLQDEPVLKEYLVQPQNIFLSILVGCLFTALVQSSAVTTGLPSSSRSKD